MRSRVSLFVALIGVLLLCTAAAPAASSGPAWSLSSPCRPKTCVLTLTYTAPAKQLVEIDVDWDFTGSSPSAMTTDVRQACGDPTTLQSSYAGTTQTCVLRSPTYATAGSRRAVLRVISNGSTRYFTKSVKVVAPPTTSSRPSPKAKPNPTEDTALCSQAKSGDNCSAGGGRKTAGGSGTGKVSHKGWPAITGVFWKVNSNSGRRFTGGAKNDELLGHHGSDRIAGGAGRDVIWGDWNPSGQPTSQRDTLSGGAGNDWIYSSHGSNTIRGGPGKDYIWAYYGRGTIDCGAGFDTLRIKLGAPFKYKNCERIKNFCSFGSKPGNKGGCYKPGEKPGGRRRR